jgi:hypothetical protein
MKRFAAFALVILSCAPAKAQYGGMGGMGGGMAVRPMTPAESIDLEIMQMEQEADKAALKEALLAQARLGMRPVPEGKAEKEFAEETVALRDFIAKKKEVMTARAAEMADKRTAGRRAPAAARASQTPEGDNKQDAVERYEKAKIEVQLLQAQVNLLQEPLGDAVTALATADIAASMDETQREKAEAARKAYDKIKEKVVELNKRLFQEQQVMLPMQQQMQQMQQMGMMGGGFR